jgi:ferrous iron transport protein B
MILAICVVMWWLSAYPRAQPTDEMTARFAQAQTLRASGTMDGITRAAVLEVETDAMMSRAQQMQSFAGRIGRLAQPAFAPLGFDEQLTVATLTSFLAREVFVSTLAVLQGAPEEDERQVIERIAQGRRGDGGPLLDTPTAAALLVFFTLAMQCLPTLALVRRETGSWRWPLLQLTWMSGLAWGGGALVRWILLAMEVR